MNAAIQGFYRSGIRHTQAFFGQGLRFFGYSILIRQITPSFITDKDGSLTIQERIERKSLEISASKVAMMLIDSWDAYIGGKYLAAEKHTR